jgi:class 3 adenylate cyclase
MSTTASRAAALAGCQNCGFENPPDSRYCGACGAALNRRCPGCGTDNPPRFNFCGTCGSPLAMSGASDEEARPQPQNARRPAPGSRDRRAGPRAPQAERRQLTVMFCDIVGSTSLSLALDPEVLREVIRSYQAVCAEAIERFGGYVAQYLGDGVLVYFGYPVALENEAERAVRAGLEVLAGVDRLNAQLARSTDIRLGVRIGVHTGLVVVGEIGGGSRREHLALGGAPNIAAKLQAAAVPDTLVVSGETQRLVARAFECVELGESPVKGVVGGGHLTAIVRGATPRCWHIATNSTLSPRALCPRRS